MSYKSCDILPECYGILFSVEERSINLILSVVCCASNVLCLYGCNILMEYAKTDAVNRLIYRNLVADHLDLLLRSGYNSFKQVTAPLQIVSSLNVTFYESYANFHVKHLC